MRKLTNSSNSRKHSECFFATKISDLQAEAIGGGISISTAAFSAGSDNAVSGGSINFTPAAVALPSESFGMGQGTADAIGTDVAANVEMVGAEDDPIATAYIHNYSYGFKHRERKIKRVFARFFRYGCA